MCGIFGFVGRPERAAAIDLAAARGALAHRGPDDHGEYRGVPVRTAAGDVACVFAHTRLAIIDVSPAGHQPMVSGDGRYVLVYNGEVYNFRELRRQLEGRGTRFRSNCDTEVVVEAFAAWGPSCVTRFRGMFAFAVWDQREGRLFLGRDRIGIKPIYLIAGPDGIAFASEVRTLLATGVAAARLSRDGLASYLAFGSVAEPHTLVADVTSLPPATTGDYTAGKLSLQRYWAVPTTRPVRMTFEAAVDLVGERLRDAVSQRLIADVPLGVFLSGGIDSSSIVSLAAAAAAGPVHTFSIAFDESAYNEGTIAAAVAKRFGCTHTETLVDAADVALELEGAMAATDQPSADGLNTYVVSKAARQAGLTVALSGLGGDEVFAGYSSFRRFRRWLMAGRLARVVPRAVWQHDSSADAFSRGANRTRTATSLRAARGEPRGTYAALRMMFDRGQATELLAPDFRRLVGGDSAFPGSWARHEPAADSEDPVNELSRLEIDNYMVNTLLRDTDAMSMAHALEVRVPFLDHLLVEELARIPGPLKIEGKQNKRLLTASVPDLPPEVMGRAKMGFTFPFELWFRSLLKPIVERMLLDGVADVPFLSQLGVERLWNGFRRGERHVSWARIWSVSSLVMWCSRERITA